MLLRVGLLLVIRRVIVLLTLATNFFIDNDFYLIFTINVHLYILIMLRFSFVCFNDVLVHVSMIPLRIYFNVVCSCHF